MSQAAALVVALLGVSGSGKSIIARRLEERGFTAINFRQPALDMIAAGFGLTDHEMTRSGGWDKPQARFGGRTVQNILSTLRHDWGRGCVHRDLWNNEVRRRILAHGAPVVISDIQRAPEVAMVHDLGGLVVRVTRADFTPSGRAAADLVEQAQLSVDMELVNSGREAFDALAKEFADTLIQKAGGQ